MNDRELLEAAAKAAGIAGRFLEWVTDNGWRCGIGHGNGDKPWNPLTSDGDALRLAVKLGMRVKVYYRIGIVSAYPDTDYGSDEPLGDDPYAATRRAIVRAAASLGAGGGEK